jgi:2-dehydropantoate 2-reductase
MKIGFIGAGSIGTLFGGRIASIKSEKYRVEVIIFGRESHIDKVNRNGLSLEKKNKIQKISNIIGFTDPLSYREFFHEMGSSPFDFTFLTTKAYDIVDAIEGYRDIIKKSKYLVILQNGLGNEDTVGQFISPEKIIRALTTEGAFLKKPGHIIHTGEGLTQIGFPFLNEDSQKSKKGKYFEDLRKLKEILSISGFKTVIEENIQKKSWEKIFVNIGINAIGALTHLENGKLIVIEELKDLMAKAVKEAYKVARGKKIPLEDKNYEESAYEVARKTYANKNSMLQDILRKKKTEIEYINGKIVQYAKQLGISVPINETLTYLIRGLEKSWNESS